MITKFSVSKYSKVDLLEPEVIKAVSDTGLSESTLIISKEAQGYINGKLKLSSSFSKKLFDVSKRCWKEIIIERSVDENGEIQLDLNSKEMSFLRIEDKILAITESENIKENVERFFNDIEKYSTMEVDKKNGFTKVILENKEREENSPYEPIVLLELDYSSGNYRAFNGLRLIDSGCMILIKKPAVNTWSLPEFLGLFNSDAELGMSEKLSEQLYSEFLSYNKDLRLSVREVLQFLRNSGVVIEVDDNTGLVSAVPGISQEYADKFIEFFNSFDMPFKSLLKLGYLKKSLKSNDFTILDMLEFLSNEYKNPMLKISGYTLSDAISMLDNGESDSTIVESEIQK